MRVVNWLGLLGSLVLGMIVCAGIDSIGVVLAMLAKDKDYQTWKSATRVTAAISVILALLFGAIEVGV